MVYFSKSSLVDSRAPLERSQFEIRALLEEGECCHWIRFRNLDKLEPKSEGINTPRKKKPKEIAIITECCTGCAGSPACVPYCPVEDCMFWVPDEDHPPFGHIEVDPFLCIGCKKCTSKGPDGSFLDGCPWDAIDMVPTEEIEAVVGKMTI